MRERIRLGIKNSTARSRCRGEAAYVDEWGWIPIEGTETEWFDTNDEPSGSVSYDADRSDVIEWLEPENEPPIPGDWTPPQGPGGFQPPGLPSGNAPPNPGQNQVPSQAPSRFPYGLGWLGDLRDSAHDFRDSFQNYMQENWNPVRDNILDTAESYREPVLQPIANLGASFIPGAGEALDTHVYLDPNNEYSDFEQNLAGGSLLLNAIFLGLTPNVGGLIRASDEIVESSDEALENLEQVVEAVVDKIDDVECNAPNRMQTVWQLGQEGEEAAGIVKNTQRIDSLSGKAKYRIPDEITKTYIKEVKNVAKLDFTAQIRDSLHYSLEQGKDFILVVRQETVLSQPIIDAVNKGWIILEYLP